MPGRVSVRGSRTAASTTKSRSLPKRVASPEPAIPEERPVNSLRIQICGVFAEVQKASGTSRKHVLALRKIQERCCYEPVQPQKQALEQDDYDEVEFNNEVARCVLRILVVKKSEQGPDRIVKFLGLFLKHATTADNVIFQDEDKDATPYIPETPTSRLTSHLISFCLSLLSSKDKVVRFRCTQVIAHIINTVDSVDDALFQLTKSGLLKRLKDKESNVRVQAVYGLARLAEDVEEHQGGEDSDDDGNHGILERLIEMLQNDPSAEVRRSLLLNLPFAPSTLPFLLERARDLDPSIRRALYSRLLPALGDFRHLSLTHREKLLRWGLRDRDENVKKATAKLFRDTWIEDCAKSRDTGSEAEITQPVQVSTPSLEALLELLERIDVVNAGVDGGIALDAMQSFWQGRSDYRESVKFDKMFWQNLTPESAFIARTFNDYCHQDGSSDLLQEKMPEVTPFALLLQQSINSLVDSVQRIASQAETGEDTIQQEFVIEQLLYIALTLDYADEMGRRTMFSLMREALTLTELPEETTRLVVEVLKAACGNNMAAEREFCEVVLEAIAEVHDTITGEEIQKPDDNVDDSFHSAVSELSGERTPTRSGQIEEEIDEDKAVQEIMVNMKCLHIAQCMLQNIDCSLEENVALVTMRENLVLPAVHSEEAPIRERGLLCLGLCCLLDKNLAADYITLFLHCFFKGHEALQNIALQIIGDILAAHPSILSIPMDDAHSTESDDTISKPLHKLFSKGLKSPIAHIQSTTCIALCKLLMSKPSSTDSGISHILKDDELLQLLAITYFDPDTINNPSLRQSLAYFLPVYCHSRKENMERMGRVALKVLQWCMSVKEDMDVDGDDDASDEMVGLSVVVAHLIDWTDSHKLAEAMTQMQVETIDEVESDVHLQMAKQILENVVDGSSKGERKLYISMLGKLNLSSSANQEMSQSVLALVDKTMEDNLAVDSTTRNILSKIHAVLNKPQRSRHASRNTSRARSLAASVADGDENLERVSDDDLGKIKIEDVTASSQHDDGESAAMLRPTRSPRNKVRIIPSGNVSEMASHVKEVQRQEDIVAEKTVPTFEGREITTDSVLPDRTTRNPKDSAIRKINGNQDTHQSVDEAVDETAILRSVEEDEAKERITTFQKNIEAFERNVQGRNEAKKAGEPQIKVEVNEPPKKPRGRPSRLAATDIEPRSASATIAPPVRRSVRSSRRQAVIIAEES